MLSLKTLLNPAPDQDDNQNLDKHLPVHTDSVPSSPAFSTGTDVGLSMIPNARSAPQDPANLSRSKLRGPVKYPPFENLDDASLMQVQMFQVVPLGAIQKSCLHIPYNSGKKDFFEKTGRESFEVFQYEFKVPGQDTAYTVMWDYNVGLVRMTPFFKCLKYGKTVPAKMLNLNPGLKEITHSITGGSIVAQGYWMPYQCARAICTTFCYHIAGALIPIFGPDFPGDCIRDDEQDFARMVIDPHLVALAIREAEASRRLHSHLSMTSFGRATSYPRSERGDTLSPLPQDEHPYGHKSHLNFDPMCGEQENEGHMISGPRSIYTFATRPPSWPSGHYPNPLYGHGQPLPNPALSAVPRSSKPVQHTSPMPHWENKRQFDHDLRSERYGSSASPPVDSALIPASPPRAAHVRRQSPLSEANRPAANQRDAAMLLLNLSAQERPVSATSTPAGYETPRAIATEDMHRTKRHRSNTPS